MRKILRKIFKHTVGKVLKKRYLQLLETNKNISSFLRTPFVINVFMQTMFVYVPDQEQFNKVDHWQSSKEMLNNTRGDCEDWAIFAAAVLGKKYIPLLMLIWATSGDVTKGHAVCLIADKRGMFGYVDNSGYQRCRFLRELNVARFVALDIFGQGFSGVTFEVKNNVF